MAVKKKNIGSGLLFFAVQVACPTGSPASYTWSVSVLWKKKKGYMGRMPRRRIKHGIEINIYYYFRPVRANYSFSAELGAGGNPD